MERQNKEPELHNGDLENAIAEFKKNQTNENMVKIMQRLGKATVIQPVFLPPNADTEALRKLVQKSQREKTPVRLNAQARPLPVVLKNDRGQQFFAVFTGKGQIPEKQKYPGMVFLPFRECARLAAEENLKLEGVVLNPFTDNLVLHRAALEMLNRQAEKRTGAQDPQVGRQETSDIPNQPAAEMPLGDRITQMELPRYFYQDKRKFMEEIAKEKEEFAAKCYRGGCRKLKGEHAACPYRKEDFEVMILHVSDTLHMARIGFAEGGALKGLCISAFCFYNPQTQEGIYYFLKRGGKGSPNLLYTVDENGTCATLGEAPPEGSELYELINRVPWEKTPCISPHKII